ncbi:hypothetical protein [Sneathiella sp.]|uniref:hypothetical protein n=1 Tax=Sneathiella sp. TaxID=1964365 RepID=UPI00356202A5
MKYTVNFQYRPADSDRPLDESQSIELSNKNDSLLLLPNIGDHVLMPSDDNINGVVENRLFMYFESDKEDLCIINIVVTDSEVDQGKLLKE